MQAGDPSMDEKDEFKELRSDQDQDGNFAQKVSDIIDVEQTRKTINSVYTDEEVKAELAKFDKDPRIGCKYLAEQIRKKLVLLLKHYVDEKKKTADWICTLTVLVGTCYGMSNFFNKKVSMFNICAFSNSKYTVTVIIERGLEPH